MFSNKQWVTDEFCENQIQADPELQVTTLGDGVESASTTPMLPNTSTGTLGALLLLVFAGVVTAGVFRLSRVTG